MTYIKSIVLVMLAIAALLAYPAASLGRTAFADHGLAMLGETMAANTADAAAVSPAQDSKSDAGGMGFYDKSKLFDPVMQLDMDPLGTSLDQHVHKVKEGSMGGYDSAGGACGCN